MDADYLRDFYSICEACGRCGACRYRAEGFAEIRKEDPCLAP